MLHSTNSNTSYLLSGDFLPNKFHGPTLVSVMSTAAT